MIILGINNGLHDASAAIFDDYELIAAVQLERLTRIKSAGRGVPWECIQEVLDIANVRLNEIDVVAMGRMALPVEYFVHFRGWRWLREKYRTRIEGADMRSVAREMLRSGARSEREIFDVDRYMRDHGFRADARLFFYNHHEAHALPTLFYSHWDTALLLTADASGDGTNYSYRYFDGREIHTLYGGEESLWRAMPHNSIGRAYGAMTEALGFRSSRHEGKLVGLSACGVPDRRDAIMEHYRVDRDGVVHSDFQKSSSVRTCMREIAASTTRENAAASIQQVLEDLISTVTTRLIERHGTSNLGLAGGVFANVRLNKALAERPEVEELFVFPPMGDEGLAIGGPLCFTLRKDGLEAWLEKRRVLDHLYLGRDYGGVVDAVMAKSNGIVAAHEEPVQGAARRLCSGEIGAIYCSRMEFGPRALGARSILANPGNRHMHEELNRRLERTEFMPFAPVVTAKRASEIFELSRASIYAARFMTITCRVQSHWRDRIPAVVHLDGTARPQIVERCTNPLYFDIIEAFARASGVPVLINTSLNVHEEPIVNSPEECVRLLQDGRIDFVVTERHVYRRHADA
jgi:carbamoyltransferase